MNLLLNVCMWGLGGVICMYLAPSLVPCGYEPMTHASLSNYIQMYSSKEHMPTTKAFVHASEHMHGILAYEMPRTSLVRMHWQWALLICLWGNQCTWWFTLLLTKHEKNKCCCFCDLIWSKQLVASLASYELGAKIHMHGFMELVHARKACM